MASDAITVDPYKAIVWRSYSGVEWIWTGIQFRRVRNQKIGKVYPGFMGWSEARIIQYMDDEHSRTYTRVSNHPLLIDPRMIMPDGI